VSTNKPTRLDDVSVHHRERRLALALHEQHHLCHLRNVCAAGNVQQHLLL
jgi:hypothetical protein